MHLPRVGLSLVIFAHRLGINGFLASVMLYAIRILKTRQKEERGNFQSDLMELYRRGEWKGGVYEGRWRGGGELKELKKRLQCTY